MFLTINYDNISCSRIRRQVSNALTYVRVELSEDPSPSLSNPTPTVQQATLNLTAIVINGINSGEIASRFQSSTATGGVAPVTYSIQEPGNLTTTNLSIIYRVELVQQPVGCREQSTCDTQPKLIAYDRNGNVINQLGPNGQPWQIEASIVGQTGVSVIGGIANYTNGQSQYTNFGVSTVGSYLFSFRFITPFGVTRYFQTTLDNSKFDFIFMFVFANLVHSFST